MPGVSEIAPAKARDLRPGESRKERPIPKVLGIERLQTGWARKHPGAVQPLGVTARSRAHSGSASASDDATSPTTEAAVSSSSRTRSRSADVDRGGRPGAESSTSRTHRDHEHRIGAKQPFSPLTLYPALGSDRGRLG